MLGGKDIVQMKSNYIPKGLVTLEKLFDQNYFAKYPKVQPIEIIFKIKMQELRFVQNYKAAKKLTCKIKRRICKSHEEIHLCVCMDL